MKSACIAIISLLGLIAAVTSANYCSRDLCSGSSHIGCNNNGAFARACPSGRTQMVVMTNSLKEKIVDSHNRKRNQIANGQLSPFRPAVRMATMQWSDELALLASYNVKRCQFQHDQCRNTVDFKYSGQNLGKSWWSGMSKSSEDVILGHIDSWWAEKKDTTMSQIDKYPSWSSRTIGHFTVMTADKNVAVGCAAIRFPENGMSSLTLACNYARTNIIGVPLYKSGPAASKCTSGKNPKYPALCSVSEKYNVNEL